MVLGFARENHFGRSSMVEGGGKNSRPFIVMGAALTFFVMKARFNFLMYLPSGALYHQVGNARLL